MDIKKLKELKAKKSAMDPLHKQAKMSVVKDMQKAAQDMMGDSLKGLKKVTVASDSPQGLKHGLDKAKEILGEKADEHSDPDMEALEEKMGDDLDHDNEEGESEAHKEAVLGHEGEEHSPDESYDSAEEEMSEEDLDKKLAELMKKKEALRSARKI